MRPILISFGYRSRKANSGAALIIALACIVILSGLVLAVLTHSMLETQISSTSANQTTASLFARGATDSVISELKQEITAGSSAYYPPTASDVRDPNCFFMPVANQAMVPYRMDSGAPPNVIKRSAYNVPFYTGTYYNSSWPAPNWAANLSTTNAGVNGRFISLARWNKPLLMPVSSSASDLTPTNTFIPPDWIYMTRTAGPATTWDTSLISPEMSNTNSVVGRYAYVVYDEGGLLDANAAGYPSSVNASMVRNKISEACADLTQIGLSSTDIDALANWRNPVNGASATNYISYIYNPSTNAFLTPSAGERMFTSRQQLISFLTQNVANGDATALTRVQTALPYLTHFSRELNSPSWYPQTNAASSGTYAYLSNSTNNPPLSSTVNIFAPLARATSSYTDVSNLTVQPNQSVAFARFPLSRLAWIGPAGAVAGNGESTTAIQQSFGLTWDSASTAWKYVADQGTVQSTILPLSQIKGREPNFFELLKAGILSGSVNVVPQPANGSFPSPGNIDSRYGTMNSSGVEVPVSDEQTMQIGLNMIDQASTNALPMRVEFGANTGTNPANGEDQALYGSKNLPYIYKMVVAHYRPTTTPVDPAGNTQAYYCAWAEPVFWSPYLSATTNTAPLQVRIRADSANSSTTYNQFYADTFVSTNQNDIRYCTPPVSCGGPGTSTDYPGTSGATIDLVSANAATLQNATVNPVLFATLLSSGAIANPPPINDIRAQNPWPGGPASADVYTEGASTYAGFWMGMALAPNVPSPADSKGGTAAFDTAVFSHGSKSPNPQGRADHEFVLEANYGTSASPKFLEVQRMTFKYWAQTPSQVQESYDHFTTPNRRLNFFTFIDPRTGRFSFDFMNPTSYNLHNAAPNPVTAADITQLTSTTFPNSSNPFSTFINNVPVTSTASISIQPTLSSAPGSNNPAQDTFRFADNSTSTYGNQNPAYFDPDGVQRPGDAWWSSTSANTMPTRIDTTLYRPVILNRPFYSVGELGYTYRDEPWRSLDFSTPKSADAGLLDFFCVNDGFGGSTTSPVIGGVLNLNTPHPEVLAAMLNGAARSQLDSTQDVGVAGPTALTMATAITSLTGTLPLLNRSELATRIAPNDPTVTAGSADSHIKERREVIVRALASAGQVRTWNLMIDVIAQTGHLAPTATGFNNFLVTAEQRYWAHVAIDRYTGQVISVQLEPVSE